MIFQSIDLTYIYEIGTVIGIGFLIFCLFLMEKIIRLFPGSNMVLKWRLMQLGVIIFIILYIIDWIVWAYDFHDLLFIISGVVRIGSSVLIALIIFLFYRTINIVFLGHKKKEEK
jgi:hypothetical protein